MSAPPLAANSKASATAPMVMPTIIWLASLASWPDPIGPTWVGRPSTCRTGRARSKSARRPPAMMARVPASAPTVPPDTGASRQSTDRAARRAAWSRASRGCMDDMSTTSVPGCRPAAVPCLNSTLSTAGPSCSMVITMWAPRTASAGSANACAPCACSASALAGLRFHTCTR